MPREATEAGQCEPSVTTNFDSDDTTFENLVKATMRTGKDFEPSADDLYYGWFVTSPEINTHPDRQHGQTRPLTRHGRAVKTRFLHSYESGVDGATDFTPDLTLVKQCHTEAPLTVSSNYPSPAAERGRNCGSKENLQR